MNLHALVSGAIGAVNPFVPATIQVFVDYTTAANGERTPVYTTLTGVACQVQALTAEDLKLLDGLNIQNTKRAIYLNGQYDGVNRPRLKGGDIFTLASGPEAGIWLVTQVIEQWPEWCKIGVTQQLPA